MLNLIQKKSFGIGKLTYPFRLIGYNFGIVIILISLSSLQEIDLTKIIFIIFAFLSPHIGFLLYKKSDSKREVEYWNLNLDAFLLGAFMVMMNFAFVPCLVFFSMIMSSHATIIGFHQIFKRSLFFFAGMILMGLIVGFNMDLASASAVEIVSLVALGIFSITYSYFGFVRSDLLRQAKSALKEQNEEIADKNEQLSALNAEKNHLLGIAAHDLKSPLNQIIGLIEVLDIAPEDLTSEQKECFDFINDSAHRMKGMIDKILDVNAIDSGKLNFNYELLDVGSYLAAKVQNFQVAAARKNIEMHFTHNDGELLINVDVDYLTQVVENLVSNALKFSEKNKNVFITVDKEGDSVAIKVRDEGPGISAEDKQQLFKKFKQLSARPTANEPSTGLGLSIVKKYTEAMGGKVSCESELGKGTTFELTFDLVKGSKKNVS